MACYSLRAHCLRSFTSIVPQRALGQLSESPWFVVEYARTAYVAFNPIVPHRALGQLS